MWCDTLLFHPLHGGHWVAEKASLHREKLPVKLPVQGWKLDIFFLGSIIYLCIIYNIWAFFLFVFNPHQRLFFNCFFSFFFFFKREMKGEKREKHWCGIETLIDCLPYKPRLGITSMRAGEWTSNLYVCTLTRNRTCHPLVTGDIPITDPHGQGSLCFFMSYFLRLRKKLFIYFSFILVLNFLSTSIFYCCWSTVVSISTHPHLPP